MTIEKIWFDDSQRPLAEKIIEAADFFVGKYGIVPSYCKVSDKHPHDPSILEEVGVEVRHRPNVQLHDFHIGSEAKVEQEA